MKSCRTKKDPDVTVVNAYLRKEVWTALDAFRADNHLSRTAAVRLILYQILIDPNATSVPGMAKSSRVHGQEIARRIAAGHPAKAVARDFGITAAYVRTIAARHGMPCRKSRRSPGAE